MPDAEPAPALKEMFNEARYRALASTLSELTPRFDRKRFLALTLEGLSERSLLQRVRRTSEALRAALPAAYPEALAVLRDLAPQVKHSFVCIVLPDFVGLYGHAHTRLSLDALATFTCYGSSEFGIREFLKRDLKGTLDVMTRWAEDKNEHVRRLASEGSRPRLPWSFHLEAIARDPELTVPILSRLMNDPSLYVRKSVANHLNDVSKEHPEWLVAWLGRQDLTRPYTAWIAKRALRTLIKRGHPGALATIGVAGRATLGRVQFDVSPKRVALGEQVRFSASLEASGRKAQRLVVDYAVHFVKASGGTSAKVFKWKELELAPGAVFTAEKTQRIRDFTTRKHHAGRHRVELLVNGCCVAETAFDLRIG